MLLVLIRGTIVCLSVKPISYIFMEKWEEKYPKIITKYASLMNPLHNLL